MSQQYEFNETQNQVISNLAHKMKFVSFFLVAIALLKLGFAILLFTQQMDYIAPLDGFITGMIYLLLGIWGIKAAGSFQQVVDTEGNDIDHLMNALGNLKNVVSLAYWLLVIFLLVFIIGIIAAIVLGGMAPPPAG
jgi:hypothetical protein